MRRVLLVALFATAMTSASPAHADPPPEHNPNAGVFTFGGEAEREPLGRDRPHGSVEVLTHDDPGLLRRR